LLYFAVCNARYRKVARVSFHLRATNSCAHCSHALFPRPRLCETLIDMEFLEAQPVSVAIRVGLAADAAEVAALRVAAANDLTERFGKGFWSSAATEKGVLQAMKQGKVLIATRAGTIVGTLALSTRKPWAIDASYFSRVRTAIYLTSMAVAPDLQGQGVGREMLAAAEEAVRGWPGDAVRLDAFDAEAGAGLFYEKCGYEERGRAVFRGVPLIYYERLLTG
jgi:GNAT superfamily N-acetyltransferase